ncbi:MAG: hypothetical protein ACYS1A_16045 [Planctomycetota bacterium]
MEKDEIKRIADYLEDLEEGLYERDYRGITTQHQLAELGRIIETLMNETFRADQELKPLLATLELKARKCKNYISCQATTIKAIKDVLCLPSYVCASGAVNNIRQDYNRIPPDVRNKHKEWYRFCQYYYYGIEAFQCAINIIWLYYQYLKSSTTFNFEGFIEYFLQLEEYERRLDSIAKRTHAIQVCEISSYTWNCGMNPGICFGDIVDVCAIGVAFKIARLVQKIIRKTRKKAKIRVKDYDSIIVCPTPELCVVDWAKTTFLQMKLELPYISDWPKWKMYASAETIHYKAYAELRENTKAYFNSLNGEKTVLPAMGSIPAFMSSSKIADFFDVQNREALRKRLDRYRKKHLLDTKLFVESQDRGKNKPKFLYNVKAVSPIIDELKDKSASVKRPSEKK